MNENELYELMRREADQAPLGDRDDLRRGRARLRQHRTVVGASGTGLAAVAIAAASVILPGAQNGSQSGLAARPDSQHAVVKADGTIIARMPSIKDVADLERQLENHDVPTDAHYAPAGKECEQPRFTPAANEDAVIGGPSLFTPAANGGWYHAIYIHPDELRPGQTVVIQTAHVQLAPVDGGGAALSFDASVAQGPVEPCKLVEDDDFIQPQFPYWDVE